MTHNPLFPRDFFVGVDLAKDSEPQVFAQKQGYLVAITNEQLESAQVWPVTIPSAEEQAANLAAQLERTRVYVDGIKVQLGKAHIELAPIIGLHAPDSRTRCTGCDAGDYAEDSPEWPCRTIELILEGLDE